MDTLSWDLLRFGLCCTVLGAAIAVSISVVVFRR